MRRKLSVLLGILLVPTLGLAGDIVTDGNVVADGTLKSTLSTGAPLEVTSTGMVANLNADMVDGVEGTDIYTKSEVDNLLAAAMAAAERGRYYLTSATVQGSGALAGCAAGYHMASLWEIADPSTLRYASDEPGALTCADGGAGPPAFTWGWIRTGMDTEPGPEPGNRQCQLWTSNSDADAGTAVSLPDNWVNPTLGLYTLVSGTPWISMATGCDETRHVWCVED
jgi:hypothetical protein